MKPIKIKKIILSIFSVLLLVSCNSEECVNSEKDACESGMDVAFVIDYTGSMGGAINGIKAGVSSIVSTIVNESEGDYRLSLSIFDEYSNGANSTYFSNSDYTSLPAANKIINSGTGVDQHLTMMEKFGFANSTTFSTQLAKLNGSMPIGSGNGWAEPGGLLMNEIVNNAFAGTWRTGVTKLMIIITDAPDGGNDDSNTALDDTALATLASDADLAGIQCLLVTTLSSSNYEISLINNNTIGGVSIVKSDFSDVSSDIITLIKNICTNNN